MKKRGCLNGKSFLKPYHVVKLFVVFVFGKKMREWYFETINRPHAYSY